MSRSDSSRNVGQPAWRDDFPNTPTFPSAVGSGCASAASFAMMEAVLLLATIAQRFRLQLVPGHTAVPAPSITLRPKHGVKVTLQRR